MKNNDQNSALIYDDNCPLCKAYTKAFVATGFLKKEHRISFGEVNISAHKIDWEKAKHEIPFINLTTGEVKYGVDALAEILQQKIFFIQPLLKIKFVNWFFKKLYALISYNRKIIVANSKSINQNFDCSPNYNFFWRGLFAIVCLVLNFFLLHKIVNALHMNFLVQPIIFSTLAILFFYSVAMCWFNKKIVTDTAVHILLSLLISNISALLFLFFIKYFFTSTIICFASAVVFLLVFVQQITQRIVFMQKIKIV
jgi:predicted DCC family thiol-disulfide oxidoreductase YuxK